MTPPTDDKPSAWARVFASIYDPLLWLEDRAGLGARRAQALSTLSGRVLEIGAGTGLNLGHYPSTVSELVLAEPESPMVKRLQRRVDGSELNASVVAAPAESLPFPDQSFDAVVSTLVLCTVDDVPASLNEIVRILRPGGRLVFVEHVRADTPRLARWQDRLERPWRAFGHGCRCNRQTLAAIEDTQGLELQQVEHGRLRVLPPIVHPLVCGVASRT